LVDKHELTIQTDEFDEHVLFMHGSKIEQSLADAQ